MVSALGAGGVGDTGTLGVAGIVAGDCLMLYCRDALYTQRKADSFAAVAEGCAKADAIANIFKELDNAVSIAPLQLAALHRNGAGGAHLNGVNTNIVAKAVHHSDLIHIVNEAVGTKQSNSLILEAGGKIIAVSIVVNV